MTLPETETETHLPLEQGKIQGKRRKWRFGSAIAAPIRRKTQSLTRKFPADDEQGICWRETGRKQRKELG